MRKLVSTIVLLGAAILVFSQSPTAFIGTWEGKLNVGVELRIVFHIKEKGNGLQASADSPDQSAFGLKCDTTYLQDDNITIEMHGLNAVFSGKLVNDTTITGTFTQGAGFSLVLNKMARAGEIPAPRKRPQTPQPPFPYRSEDVEYDNAGKSLHYGATITIPNGKGPFPAAVLISGSGAQNRDEEIMGHHLFAVIADALTREGMIVLRVDDRGVGKSTGRFSDATSADFAEDVKVSLNYLLSRPETDPKRVGLIGHSEGGMIAPVVASERKDVNFIILLAGPGEAITELMTEQNAAILRSAGISSKSIDAFVPLYRNLVVTIRNSSDSSAAIRETSGQLNSWMAAQAPETLKELGFVSEQAGARFISDLVHAFSTKWFRHFLAFDPAPYLQQLQCKVLAINGDRDIQVISSSNLAGIRKSLAQSKAKNVEIKELPGLNHLFQQCRKCTLAEYGELEETIAPSALGVITGWIKKNVL